MKALQNFQTLQKPTRRISQRPGGFQIGSFAQASSWANQKNQERTKRLLQKNPKLEKLRKDINNRTL